MKNQKGITMASLVIYIVSFSIIIGIVGYVITFFSNNAGGLNQTAARNVEYNKFNSYMSQLVKKGYTVITSEYNENPYIYLEKGDDKIVFEKINDILYMDNVKLCEKVEEFDARKSISENGSEMLKIKIKINGVVYSNDYILEGFEE